MPAKVTIGRRSKSHGDDCVSISIEDRSSGIAIIGVEMSFEEFAKALTGMAYCKGEYSHIVSDKHFANIGMIRESKSVFIDRPKSYSTDKRKHEIAKSIEESGELVDGWKVFRDGTDTQQPGTRHRVYLYRFVNQRGA